MSDSQAQTAPGKIYAPRFSHVPAELAARPQWIVWQAVWDAAKGKYNKIPYNAKTGAKAASTRPAEWASLDVARAAYEKSNITTQPPGKYAGVGFVLSPDDPFVGIDLDHVIDGVEVGDEAMATLVRFNSYSEISPSGTGLRIFVEAPDGLPAQGRKKGDVEMYADGRFLTVTGRRLPGTPAGVAERQDVLLAYHAEIFRPVVPPPAAKPARAASSASVSDFDLLQAATKAANGAKIDALYNGDTSGYAGASEADLAFCTLLGFYSLGDAARLDAWFRDSKLMRPKWDEPHYAGGETYGQRTVQKGIDAQKGQFYTPPGSPEAKARGRELAKQAEREKRLRWKQDDAEAPIPDDLADIIVTARDDRDIANDVWHALLLQNDPPEFFTRGGGLVRLRRDPDKGRIETQAVEKEIMLHRMRRVASYKSLRKDKDTGEITETPVTAPPRIAGDMLVDKTHISALPSLRAILHAPCVGKNGSLLTAPGYHEHDRVFLDLDGLPAMHKSAAGKEEARAAFERLFGRDGVYGEFPFAEPTDRAHAAAFLLTPFLRPYIGGNVPMGIIEAPEKGTGKSILARNLLRVFDPFPVSQDAPTGRTKEDAETEWSKVLGTALKGAPSTLFFDNVRGQLASQALEALLTSPDPWSTRLLGTGENVTVWPDLLTLVATSNNPEMSRDMARRCYLIRLDAGMEKPEERSGFRIGNLDAHVTRERPAIIADVLVMLSAWVNAGRPDGEAVSGSFDRWAKVVSGLLDFLDVPGFLETSEERTAALDPETARWGAFFKAWFAKFDAQEVVAKDLLEEAVSTEIIADASHVGAGRTLGKMLGRQRDRVCGGYKMLSRTGQGGIFRYYLRPASAPNGLFGGSGGFSASNPPAREAKNASRATENASRMRGNSATKPTTPTIDDGEEL